MSRKRRPLLVRFAQPLWAMCNDVALKIHTIPSAEPSASTQLIARTAGREDDVRPRHDDSVEYEVPDYLYLRRVVRSLKPCPEDVIFDLGCGMGRFLCLMARRKVRKCVGVELLPHLCEAARKNAAQLRGRQAPIEIRCADAATADPSGGTIYYLFNPFGSATMGEVLANIRGTLTSNPRNITIVYYNAIHEGLFQASGWLEKYHAFRVQSGMAVTFWRNRQGANPPQPHKT
jgi:SAM-dependent methyltransferase